jgi:hypothetical protein
VPPRTFTPEEANAALDEVRPLAEEMVAHGRELARAQERQAELQGRIAGNGSSIRTDEPARLVADVDRAAAGLARCIERLHALGVQVKDVERGLLDFPALRGDAPGGEELVLLCWHVGEDEVAYWHGLEDGFAGRRPLPL